MDGDEYGQIVWRAGDVVAAGIYLRVDDRSYRVVVLELEGALPASYDGHVAWYCRAPEVRWPQPPAAVLAPVVERPAEQSR